MVVAFASLQNKPRVQVPVFVATSAIPSPCGGRKATQPCRSPHVAPIGAAATAAVAALVAVVPTAVARSLKVRGARWRRRCEAARRCAYRKGFVSMERPLLDNLVTSLVKTVETAELGRVSAVAESPSDLNGGWAGEPRAWADEASFTQRISKLSQVGPLAQAKQFIADTLAGDYDREAVSTLIRSRIAANKVMMFSFSTCPFCLRAKQIIREDYGEAVEIYECDIEAEGYAVRAELGRLTGRTSMPSTWLGPDVLLGGCNDGGLGGVATLDRQGKLAPLLAERSQQIDPLAGVLGWLWNPGSGSGTQAVAAMKRELLAACTEAPKNGVGATPAQQKNVWAAALKLQNKCPVQPARKPLLGVWELAYCTNQGGSSGKLGPFVGDVTQTFLDDCRFINAVELGPLRVALEAEWDVVNDTRIRVSFREMAFSLLGMELFRKPAKGKGVWEQCYVDSNLRVMKTPSVFVLRKKRG